MTVSEMAAPLETSRSCIITIFCQGIAPKNFACGGIIPPLPQVVASCKRQAVARNVNNSQPPAQDCKIFRALDNDLPLKSKHARSGFPPRALITKLPPRLRTCALSSKFCKYCPIHFTCPLADVSFLPPLTRGRTVLFALSSARGGMRSFRVQGRKYPAETFFGGDPVRKTAPAVFASFCAQKEGYFPRRLNNSSKRTAVQTRLHKLFANAQKYASCVDKERGAGYNTLKVYK